MIVPRDDRILIRAKEKDTATASGILLPETKEKQEIGTVLAVGPGKLIKGQRIPSEVQVGDEVLFLKYSGSSVKFEGEYLALIPEKDILAVLA